MNVKDAGGGYKDFIKKTRVRLETGKLDVIVGGKMERGVGMTKIPARQTCRPGLCPERLPVQQIKSTIPRWSYSALTGTCRILQ
jgi:hypothetical protein